MTADTSPPAASEPAPAVRPSQSAVGADSDAVGQIFPPLSAEQYDALSQDIAKRGMMVPVEVDADTGEILDGNHRTKIAAALGITPPTVLRRFASQAERIEHALKLNLLRRQMDDETWADAFERLAKVRGVVLDKAGRPTKSRHLGAISQESLASELGTTKRTAQRRRQNAKRTKAIREKAPDIADKVKAGDVDVKRGERLLRERQADERRAATASDPQALPPAVDLRHGDFREVLDDLAGTVDAIITDPPYPREYAALYPAITQLAARLLKPSGSLIVLCGTRPDAWLRRLPEMEEHMPLRWVGCYLTTGASYRDQQAKIATNWKPVLIFGAERPLNTDVFRSSGDDKEHHHWGQNEGAFAAIVEAFTGIADLVVDPFLGGGTTAVVSFDLGRRFVGSDVDETSIAISRARFA